MRVDQPFSYSGYFWLPENESMKVPGTLHVVNGGKPEIELLGDFTGGRLDLLLDDSNQLFRVVGLIDTHGFVTLEGCWYRGKSASLFDGFSKSTVVADSLLVGCHFGAADDWAFNEFRFSIDGLNEWLSVDAIQVEHDKTGFGATINFAMPKKVPVYSVQDEFSLVFDFDGSLPGLGRAPTEARVSVNAYLRIRYETPRPLSDFIEIAYRVTQLMRLVIGDKVSIRDVFVAHDSIKHDFPEGRKPNRLFRLYYASLPFDSDIPKIESYRMLFSFAWAEHRLSKMLDHWFKMYGQFEPALALFFLTFAGHYKYLDQRFLALAQALEVLHRRTTDKSRLPEDDFEALKKTLLDNCPDAHRAWLFQRLHFANEIFLSERLTELALPFSSLFGGDSEVEKMVKKIKDTRNYMTHFDPSLEKKAASGRDLWILCEKAEALICLHLLHRIGMTSDELLAVSKNENRVKKALSAL